jgi:AAA+ ATPase superfamily predicted ATPase
MVRIARAPRKPPIIIDREREWKELTSLCRSNRPELIFVLGRRRAGKSFVLSKFASAMQGLYYQASSRTENEQLLNLSLIVGKTFGDAALQRGVPFPSWDALLNDLTERALRRPLLVVLDEFPYLATAAPGITSLIQRHWDHLWAKVPIKLVLSGSHITAMQRFEDGDQPLYGRRTGRIQFLPFAYKQIRTFLPHYDEDDLLRAYGIFGGLPGHLSLLDPAVDLGTNVARVLLRPNGRLYDDAQHLLDAFLPNAEVHYSIIEAIARGERTWSRITSRVGRDGGSLLRPTQWLQDMGLIRRVVPVTEANARASKRAVYEIADPYLMFWHRFIAPLVSSGGVTTQDSDLLWRKVITPRLDDYMGEVFENVCREFVRDGAGLRFKAVRTGRWWDGTMANEIDIVATDGGTCVLVAECKWGQVDSRDLKALRERTTVMVREFGEVTSVKYALFSRGRPSDPALLREIESGQVSWYGPQALFQQSARSATRSGQSQR